MLWCAFGFCVTKGSLFSLRQGSRRWSGNLKSCHLLYMQNSHAQFGTSLPSAEITIVPISVCMLISMHGTVLVHECKVPPNLTPSLDTCMQLWHLSKTEEILDDSSTAAVQKDKKRFRDLSVERWNMAFKMYKTKFPAYIACVLVFLCVSYIWWSVSLC